MGYVTTGIQRRKKLRVTKSVAGNQITQNEYLITDAFTYGGVNYAALSDTDFARLSDATYATRLSAFLNNVYVLEPGFSAPDIQNTSTATNNTACPPNAPVI